MKINEFIKTQITTPDPQNVEVNGFTLEIESNQPSEELPVPRRRAIAKDSSGIVVLKGEYSYTADPQILIEELKFYIQTNDLKPF